MGTPELLLELAEKMLSLAETIQTISHNIGQPDTPPAEAPSPPPPASKPDKPIALEDVRAVLAEKSHDGLTAEVRALLQKYGADKLSAVDPQHYPALLAEAEVLGNAP